MKVVALFAAAAISLAGGLAAPVPAQVGCDNEGCPREDVLTPAEAAGIERAVETIAADVLAAAGVAGDVAFAAKDWVTNARAYRRDGIAEIGYNPLWVRRFLDDLDGDGGWHLRAFLAHEIGHHALGHTTRRATVDRHGHELEADAFAGFALRRLGASARQATSLWRVMAMPASSSHPRRALRVAAVEGGWSEADAGGTVEGAVGRAAAVRR